LINASALRRKEDAMDINLATVMLHIQEPLDELSRRRLEDTMREDACVVSVGMPDNPPRSILIAYNPACTNSENILRRATRTGLHAKLVGCA
jgi:hypothetical protein